MLPVASNAMLSGPYRHNLHEAACAAGTRADIASISSNNNGSFMVRLDPEFRKALIATGGGHGSHGLGGRRVGARDQSGAGWHSRLAVPERNAMEWARH